MFGVWIYDKYNLLMKVFQFFIVDRVIDKFGINLYL